MFGTKAATMQQWHSQKHQTRLIKVLVLSLRLCHAHAIMSYTCIYYVIHMHSLCHTHVFMSSTCIYYVIHMHLLCHTHVFMSCRCIYVIHMHLCHAHAFMSYIWIYVIHMNLCHAHASIMSCTCVYDTFLFAFLLCPLWRNASSHLRATAPSLRQVMC